MKFLGSSNTKPLSYVIQHLKNRLLPLGLFLFILGSTQARLQDAWCRAYTVV